ncbi:hypothetical protein LguiA_032499 [Lonicera macranthoides]
MAGPSWLVDSNRIATKIRNASGSCDPGRVIWKSNPTKACPNCLHIVDNSDVNQEWPGLPRGVKFDPSDQEIIWHLLAKSGVGKLKPHPFIDEFIPTVEEDGGICYTHPQNLPGAKQDGSVSHFFHRAIKAYNTGTRKRRKINGVDLGDVRWHKTGRTKPVNLDGVQRGCKKIMVLYASLVRGGKPEKTNWVMHQYHLGTGEDEKEGEYVISKVFYQQQQVKQSERIDEDLPEAIDATIVEVDPVTPTSATPLPPRAEKKISDFDPGQRSTVACVDPFVPLCEIGCIEDEVEDATENTVNEDHLKAENQADEVGHNNDSQNGEDLKWSDSMSQYWLDSQQLKECLPLCDDLFQSQSPNRDGSDNKELRSKPHLSDYYANLGPEDLKKDLQECQDLVLDPANIEIDTPDDFRLSQLEFGSQSSFLEWGGSKEVK